MTSMPHKPGLLFLLIALVFWCLPGQANVFVNPESYNLNFYIGSLDPDEEAGVLENPSSNIAIGFASNNQSRTYPYLGVDLELWLLQSEYANTLPPPLFVSLNDEMELETLVLSIGGRVMVPYGTPYRFYLSAGYGYYYSDMRVYANLLGIPGYYEDSTQTIAPYFGAGFRYEMGYRQTLEIFYRKWTPEGDFKGFSIPETELGGEVMGIGFGLLW
ncbi:MAG: hypothetical protein PVJ63_10070 [Thioalkalispiraceae bacterium]